MSSQIQDVIVLNDGQPLDLRTNCSTVISFNAAGEAVKIQKTIGATTYTKTITRSDNVIVSTLPISAWS